MKKQTRNTLIVFILIMLFIILLVIFVLNRNSNEKNTPQVTISNIETDWTQITFDMGIEDEGLLINEITIRISHNSELVEYLDTSDGIKTSGHTEDILFSNLIIDTSYIIDVIIDFSTQDEKHPEHLAKSFAASTRGLSNDVSIDMTNVTQNDGKIEFDYTVQGEIEELVINLTDENGTILDRLTSSEDGLSLVSHTGAYFQFIRNDVTFKLQFIINVQEDDILIKDLIIFTHTFITGTYQYEPEANVYNIRMQGTTMYFSVNIIDQFEFLVNAIVYLENLNGDTIDSFSLSSAGTHNNLSFSGLLSNTTYTILVVAEFTTDGISFIEQTLFTQSVFTDIVMISTVEELININDDLAGQFKVANDISLAGVEWLPIGSIDNPFTGLLDGNGFTISNLTITFADNQYIGFFGGVSGQAIIKDLTLYDINIDVTNCPHDLWVGGLIARIVPENNVSIEIDNVQISGNIILASTEKRIYVGGSIGQSSDNVLISNSLNNINIIVADASGNSFVGGFIGDGNSTIFNSYNLGDVTAFSSSQIYEIFIGGFTGNGSITISNSNNSGIITAISSNSSYASGFIGRVYGGFIGDTNAFAIISNCSNIGDINIEASYTGGNYAGGFFGFASRSLINISNSYNMGTIIVDTIYNGFAGGFVGRIYSTKGTDTFWNNLSLGEVKVVNQSSSAGVIFGSYDKADLNNNFYINNTGVSNNDSTLVTISQLNSESFFTDVLNWDPEIWNFENLDFENGLLPKLRGLANIGISRSNILTF